MKVTKRVFDLNKFAQWVEEDNDKTQSELKVAHYAPIGDTGKPWAVDAVGVEYNEFVKQYAVVCDEWFTEVPLTPYFSLKKYIESMMHEVKSDVYLYRYITLDWVADCLDKTVEECKTMYVISDNWVEYR